MKLEIDKKDVEKSIELFGKVGIAQTEDVEPKRKELQDKTWVAYETFRRSQIVDDRNIRKKYSAYEKFKTELHQVIPDRNKRIEGAKGELEVVIGPYKTEMVDLIGKEAERIKKLKSYQVSTEKLYSKQTGAPIVKLTTNVDDIFKTINKLFKESKKLKERITSLDILEKEFNEIISDIPKTFPLNKIMFFSQEDFILFSERFKEPFPQFDMKTWPDINQEAAASSFLETLDSLKVKISHVNVD